jgi:hypothetical protein
VYLLSQDCYETVQKTALVMLQKLETILQAEVRVYICFPSHKRFVFTISGNSLTGVL